MGLTISSLFSRLFGKKQMRILMAVSDDDPAHVRFKNTLTSNFTKCKEDTSVKFLKIAIAPRFRILKCLPKSEKDEMWRMLSEVLKKKQPDAGTTEP